MIGQMQGKFQLAVVSDVGHMVHEVPLSSFPCLLLMWYGLQDDPARLAEILVGFWKRNDRVVVGVKKVGES